MAVARLTEAAVCSEPIPLSDDVRRSREGSSRCTHLNSVFDANSQLTCAPLWRSGTVTLRHRQMGKNARNGVRSAVRSTGLGKAGTRALEPPQGSRTFRLPRCSRSNGLYPASGCRKVLTRGSGCVHRPATGRRVCREYGHCCANVAAIRPRANVELSVYAAARRGASSSRMDCHRALGPWSPGARVRGYP